MANFRRAKPRLRTFGNFSDKTDWLSTWPAWWDRERHTRPARRREKAELGRLARGVIDLDGAIFDPPKRPHVYWW